MNAWLLLGLVGGSLLVGTWYLLTWGIRALKGGRRGLGLLLLLTTTLFVCGVGFWLYMVAITTLLVNSLLT